MGRLSRRDFLRTAGCGAGAAALAGVLPRLRGLAVGEARAAGKPNVVLCMADDLGWGDTGYNGHPVLRTPNLDRMAAEGVRFERFYAGAPVCSPTRGSCVTGRHPYRYGIFFANVGHMPKQEVTLAEVLRSQGYATGHFGKWHLGTLTRTVKDANRGGPRGAAHYSPPWENGFDVCFSTESKVPTWDPMRKPVRGASGTGWACLGPGDPFEPYGTRYWTGPEQAAEENLEGDDSRVIMDRAVPFIGEAVAKRRPFLAVVWFHAPHLPVVAGPEYARMYEREAIYPRSYHGCITAMDEQVGRLRAELARLGVSGDTILWFASDNGPEGNDSAPGRTRGLRGRKRSLYEGGVRVPGLLVWPDRAREPRTVSVPCSTSDYFPTVLDALGYKLPEARTRPYDGVSLLPLLDGTMKDRPRPIGFESAGQVSLTSNQYKIYRAKERGEFELYDLVDDPGERTDLAREKPEVVAEMRGVLEGWRASCKASLGGKDYAPAE